MTPDPLRALASKALPAQLFVAGFCGLVFEVVWTRRLHNLLGTSGQAQAVVLASFMGGLALGAWLFSRLSDRPSADPLRDSRLLLGGTQVALALWAFGFRFILRGVESAWLATAGGEGAGREVLRVLFAAFALVPAAAWVGAAFPLVFRIARADGRSSTVASLYAVDGIGAALGTLIAGLLMLPTDGLAATEQKAAFFSLLNGIFSLLAARGVTPLPASGHPPPQGEGVDLSPSQATSLDMRAANAALLVTAMAGFAAMLHQLAWTRLLTTMIGGSTYAFTLILAAFVLGLGLGSWWLSRRKFANPLAALARAQWLLVISISLALPTYSRLPYIFLQLQWALRRGTQTFFLYELFTFGLCGALVLIPALFMGASFPLAAETVMRGRAGTARPLGSAYLWNTAGTVLGALLGGLVFLPLLGLEGAFALGLLLNLFAAAGAAWNGAGRRWPAFVPIAATSVLLGGVAMTSMGWSSFANASGRGREWEQVFESFEAFRTEVARRAEVRFQRDDSFGSVLVGESKGGERYLRINGKLEASNGSSALITPVLAGHLGFFTGAKENGRVLLVGLGSGGITAGALLTHPIERLDVVEISPAVADAARYFSADNHAALDDPRLHLHLEDAKTFLALSKDQYDLIVSAPPSPGASGDTGLFTIDFFRAARSHLAHDGRFVQVLKAEDLGEPLLKLFMRTMRDSFPRGSSWLGPKDLLVVGSLESQHVDHDLLARKLAEPKVADDVARALVLDAPTLLSLQVHSDQGQAALAGTGAVNTDDRNRLEFGAPVAHYAGEAVDLHDERRSREPAQLELGRWLHEQPLDAAQAEHIWRALSATHLPQDAVVRSAADAWLLRAPESSQARLAVARSAWAQTDAAAVRELLRPAVAAGERDPDLIALWLRCELTEAKRAGALWNPVDLGEPLRIAKEVGAAHPDHLKLAEVLKEAAK